MSLTVSDTSSTQSGFSPIASGSSTLDQDTFLKLLTTQLQHQDPLNPMSNEEFVAQLAQFSSLEQLQGVNSQLESLTLINTSMNNASMVNLLGKEVVASSDTFHYDGEGGQNIMFQSETDIADGTITVQDENGNVVDTISISNLDSGENTIYWDGVGNSGEVPEGDYHFVINATDANGNAVATSPLVQGVVDRLSFESGSPQPYVDGVAVSIGSIIRLTTGDTP